MKKVTSLLVIILVVSLIFVGCAKPAPTPVPVPAPTPAPTPTPTPTPEEQAAAFYKGKNITLDISSPPGGGFDTYARLITPYLEEYTGANVLVRNMPGGEHYVGIGYAYRAKPDGLTIHLLHAVVAVMNQLGKSPIAKGIDVLEFRWLARVSRDRQVILLGTKSPYRSIDDLVAAKEPIKWGSTGRGDNSQLPISVLSQIFGLNSEIILGIAGTSGLVLATMRGEIDGYGCSEGTAADHAKQPEISPLCTASRDRSPLLPEVPTIDELVTLTPEQLKWLDTLNSIVDAGRTMVVTPGTPEGRVQFLRSALDSCLHNEEFLAKAEQVERPISYLAGEEMEKLMAKLLSMPESEAKEVTHLLLEEYVK